MSLHLTESNNKLMFPTPTIFLQENVFLSYRNLFETVFWAQSSSQEMTYLCGKAFLSFNAASRSWGHLLICRTLIRYLFYHPCRSVCLSVCMHVNHIQAESYRAEKWSPLELGLWGTIYGLWTEFVFCIVAVSAFNHGAISLALV